MSKWYKTKEREQRNPVQQRRSRHAARRNERPARPARWSWRQFASPGARHGILFEGAVSAAPLALDHYRAPLADPSDDSVARHCHPLDHRSSAAEAGLPTPPKGTTMTNVLFGLRRSEERWSRPGRKPPASARAAPKTMAPGLLEGDVSAFAEGVRTKFIDVGSRRPAWS
jgi:hypothetical protein